MSHRTNYALREGGRVRFSTSRHGGTSIPDLLFVGPDEIEDYLSEDEPVGPDALYDGGVCEGLLVIDKDEQVVLFDGVSELMYEGAIRRLWYPLLETVWKGWHLVHTPDPVRHLGLHLGLPDEWRAAKHTLRRNAPSGQALRTYDPHWIADHQTEIQVHTESGRALATVVDIEPIDLFDYGPRLLDLLADREPVERRDQLPPWGLLVAEVPSKHLRIWLDVPVYRLIAEMRERWSGWTIEHLSTEEAARQTATPDRFLPTPEEQDRARTVLAERLGTDVLASAVRRAAEVVAEREATLRRLLDRPA